MFAGFLNVKKKKIAEQLLIHGCHRINPRLPRLTICDPNARYG